MRQFKCAICHGIYENGNSEEEAEARLKEQFGDIDKKDCEIVCEDCYEKFMEWWKNENNKQTN